MKHRISKYRLFARINIFIRGLIVLGNYVCREKLELERAAREKAEKKHQEYEERLKSLQEEMLKREQELQEAQVRSLICHWSRRSL